VRSLDSRVDEALDVVTEVERALRPGEHADVHLANSPHRTLTLEPDGGRRMAVRGGGLDGYLRLGRDGRELYVSTPGLTAPGVADVLETARSAYPLAAPTPSHHRSPLHEHPAGEGVFHWENTPERTDLEAVAADAARLTESIGGAAGGAGTLRRVDVVETLGESVFARSGGPRRASRCRGVEVRAVFSDATGTAVSLSRRAAALDAIDLAGLGRELVLTTAAFAPGRRAFTGDRVVFTPHASAELLRHLVAALLLNPLARRRPWGSAVIDDGRVRDSPAARAFDCEGTPTGRVELVDRDGAQHPIATHLRSVAADGDRTDRLTGHALWEAGKGFPQINATSVHLAAGGDLVDPLAGERVVVAHVRGLGVEEHRSGGQLAFRLLLVRAVDGVPREALPPVSVAGGAVDFLAAVRAVGETVTYAPGAVAVGGAHLELSLADLPSRSTS
jgi:predicted Zn-dependent protease